MKFESKTVSVWIDRIADVVYEFAANPSNLPAWASGLGELVDSTGDSVVFDTPAGRATMRYVPRNEFGVLDHSVSLPSGQTIEVPMRVIPNGSGSEVMLTLFRQPEVSDTVFADDVAWVERDLLALKALLES